MGKTIAEMQKRCWQTAEDSGFHEEGANTNPAAWVANLHGEVSEFWEAYRKGLLDHYCDKESEMRAAGAEPLTCAEEELADIAIRVMDVAEQKGIDLERAVIEKDKYNQTRPYRHGNKKA